MEYYCGVFYLRTFANARLVSSRGAAVAITPPGVRRRVRGGGGEREHVAPLNMPLPARAHWCPEQTSAEWLTWKYDFFFYFMLNAYRDYARQLRLMRFYNTFNIQVHPCFLFCFLFFLGHMPAFKLHLDNLFDSTCFIHPDLQRVETHQEEVQHCYDIPH